MKETTSQHVENKKTIVLGAGCFWCVEAIFELVRGVTEIEVGYSGGDPMRANYKEVCQGDTNHVEVVKVSFDANDISVLDLLRIFFVSHDPTTLNQQGNDVGTQYRSVIFYADDEQKKAAQEVLAEMQGLYHGKIVTAIEPLTNYFIAEDYHRKYFKNNPEQGYCRIVIAPKVQKFRAKFQHLLRES